MNGSLGQVVVAFFEDHLKVQKGLRPGSIRSYRDTIKLLLVHVAALCSRPITRLTLKDLAFDRVLDFLRTIEEQRGNQPRTRNQRLAALRTFYRYLAVHHPEMLAEAQRVEAIPTKRAQPSRTIYLERDEIDALFRTLPTDGNVALRDRALLMFLYNTGARVQEAADLRNADVDVDEPYKVRLHGNPRRSAVSTRQRPCRAVGREIGTQTLEGDLTHQRQQVNRRTERIGGLR
jgi:site-specific recombinase XerD